MPPEKCPNLSVSIVCCNNEQTIRRTLESVAPIASEVVALDSGSTDATREILAEFGATVIDQPWLGHVKQKQAALERCTLPWVLHMDSDESLDDELQRAVADTVTVDHPSMSGYAVNRRVWMAGKPLRHAWQPEWRLRLVRRGAAKWTGADPHDRLELATGNSAKLPGFMRHDTMPSLAEFLKRQADHARISAESSTSSTSVLRLVTSPLGAWSKQMFLKQAFRDGWRGWCAASAAGMSAAMKHMILLEKQHTTRD